MTAVHARPPSLLEDRVRPFAPPAVLTRLAARPVRDRGWARAYARRIVATDLAAIALALALGAWTAGDALAPAAPWYALGIAAAWMAALSFTRSRHRRVLGSGTAEPQAVVQATLRLVAGVAVVAVALDAEVGRRSLLVVLPSGLLLLLLGRLVWRRRLQRARRAGRSSATVLVVGPADTAGQLVHRMAAAPASGYRPVGVCLAGDEPAAGGVLDVPVVGRLQDTASVARAIGADVVAVTGADALTADVVRRLGWDLEPTGVDLVLAPALVDVAGPRIRMTPAEGLPLIHVDAPRFSGPKYVLKSVVDWLGAALITIAISPVLLGIALLVALSSPGPVFYRQTRIGRDGTTFGMLKFRSMVVGAHDRLAEVLAAEGVSEVGLFYKPTNDPRVTPVGRVLRKYSLDELPQLVNVLRGEMSLVGPRPQIDREVAQYDRAAHRRLRVKPGLTGLWQVSGRSALSPEEGIRMDLAYVENWTVAGDVAILARTARAMVLGDGAR